jgi:hypothetical protein
MYICKILSPIPIDTQEPTNKQLSIIQAINNITTMHASGGPKIKVILEPNTTTFGVVFHIFPIDFPHCCHAFDDSYHGLYVTNL